MSIENFYNTAVSVFRLVKEDNESPRDIEEYQLYLEDIPCLIYPVEDSYGQDLEGSYGKDSMMVVGNNVDILEKDKVIDSEGKEYVVVGVRHYEFSRKNITEIRIREMPSVKTEGSPSV